MSYLLDYNPGTQQWGYPRRGANLSGTCIIHTAECAMDLEGDDTSAEVCANFIANRSDYGSYHRLVDSDSIIDMIPFEYEAWQDSETNPWAVGISAAVQAGKWTSIPADRRDRIYRNMATAAAEFVRHMARKGITVPLRRITGDEARARVPGFCAHGDSGIARTDPGVQFEWALFFAYTQAALSGGLSAQGTITPIVQEDEMRDDQMLELKLFIQNEIERREVVTRELAAKNLAAAVYELKLFVQDDDEKRHVATRNVIAEEIKDAGK